MVDLCVEVLLFYFAHPYNPSLIIWLWMKNERKKEVRAMDSSKRTIHPKKGLSYLRKVRWPNGVKCICGGDVIKKGKTNKGAQRYQCKKCKKYFNDLTGTIFNSSKFKIEEMFYIIKEIESKTTYQIASELGRDYEAVLNFVHKVQRISSMQRKSLLR